MSFSSVPIRTRFQPVRTIPDGLLSIAGAVIRVPGGMPVYPEQLPQFTRKFPSPFEQQSRVYKYSSSRNCVGLAILIQCKPFFELLIELRVRIQLNCLLLIVYCLIKIAIVGAGRSESINEIRQLPGG